MTEPLTESRFVELADAYGSVIARWPEAVRAEAMEMATHPRMQAVLADAGRLDAQLDLWRVPSPNPAFAARILGTFRSPLISRRIRLWWSGIGIATALAGAAAGSVAAAVVLPAVHAGSEDTTAFGDLGQEN